ncbi:protein of unknown function [Shewanella benthica]|uniref:Uncharacterized protein n=1 Tax=Shewanella benthica TaxID=43661 RepID=A0A330LXJ1_9GAMM|nr:protein of unknown function [Shewanella benthica]
MSHCDFMIIVVIMKLTLATIIAPKHFRIDSHSKNRVCMIYWASTIAYFIDP